MSAAEEALVEALESAGVTGWEREHQFDRRTELCECRRHRYTSEPTGQPRILSWTPTGAPVGHVPGKRKAWIKCRACKGAGFVKRGREWRADFAFKRERVLVEVDGGGWVRGRHHRPAGFAADCEKHNTAALAGWLVVRVTPEHVRSGEALSWIRAALEMRGDENARDETQRTHGAQESAQRRE